MARRVTDAQTKAVAMVAEAKGRRVGDNARQVFLMQKWTA
jgi:hypothetical protein